MGQKEASATAFEMKARNGFSVRAAENGGIEVKGTGGVRDYTPPMAAFAIEEFCQARRDAALGRWRCPEDPNWIAQEGDRDVDGRRTVYLFNEQSFELHWLNDRVMERGAGELTRHRVARAFFKAHPERKPWEEAKPGDVWLLTVAGHEAAFVADQDSFNGTNAHGRLITTLNGYRDDDITAGRRIWPEDAS